MKGRQTVTLDRCKELRVRLGMVLLGAGSGADRGPDPTLMNADWVSLGPELDGLEFRIE